MVKLESLTIHSFRNVEPETKLVFDDGYNVLLGQNGTGKTTLLELVAMALPTRLHPLGQGAAGQAELLQQLRLPLRAQRPSLCARTEPRSSPSERTSRLSLEQRVQGAAARRR
jgi:recombinational DNA repair ATPase RecF